MALLDMSRKKGLDLVACHVNYQKRASAWRDEKILKDYCAKYGIALYVAYAPDFDGNFQSRARTFRYDFFLKIARLKKADQILMAHQRDDYLESVLMQAKRGDYSTYYGIRKVSFYKSLKIIRPLLDLSKKDLEHYCLLNNIEYGDDETNFSDHYTRNYIRHHDLKRLSNKDKDDLYQKIQKIDQKLLKKETDYLKKYARVHSYSLKEVLKIEDLRLFLDIKLEKHLSKAEYQELKRQLLSSESFEYETKKIKLYKEGDVLTFVKEEPYNYLLRSLEVLKTPYFETNPTYKEGYSAIHLEKDDFPLLIRNPLNGDKIKLLKGSKKISRIFIDEKVQKSKRKLSPIVLNKRGEVIMVPPFRVKVGYLDKAPNFYLKNLLIKR